MVFRHNTHHQLVHHLFADDSASGSMSEVHVVEMANKRRGVLLRQLYQKGSVRNARSRWFRNCVTLLPEPFQIPAERLRSLQTSIPELGIWKHVSNVGISKHAPHRGKE